MKAVPILTYHSLDDTGSVISTAPAAFRSQMRQLRDRGYQGISLGALLDAWDGGAPLPARPVVLTFDDAFGSVGEVAAPVLCEVGFRATIFAVAGYCGRDNDWPTQGVGAPRLPLLSWSQLNALASDGFEIGSHGLNHAPLDRLGRAEARAEIADSRKRLEDGLSRSVTLFAFPYGVADRASRELVATHYRAACSVEMATARPGDDRHWLPRIDAHYLGPNVIFLLFGTPLGRLYLGLRALGRRGRSALGLSLGPRP